MRKMIRIYGLIVIGLLFLLGEGIYAKDLTDFVSIPASDTIKSFHIGKYPVTNEQYKVFTDDTGKKVPSYWKSGTYPEGKANHPVVFVSYNDAMDYCQWLSIKYPQYSFRLPTVKEWEYVASGGKDIAFPWGDKADDNNFNYNKQVASFYLKKNPTVTYTNPKSASYGKSMPLNQVISINSRGGISGWIDHKNYTGFVYTDLFQTIMSEGGYTTPVSQYPNGKSAFGVYDMSGNVWEWTNTQITATNGAEKGQSVYAIKGGSWYANPSSCKITMSGEGRRPNTGYNTVGFRVVAVKAGTVTEDDIQTSTVKEIPQKANPNKFTKEKPSSNTKNGKVKPSGKSRPSKKPDFKPGGERTPSQWN